MLTLRYRQYGVSLIELMVGITIVGILLWVGIPSFQLWIQNTQNRSAAESILNGIQMARVEAVRRNTPVRFSLTSASGEINWTVGCVNVSTECPAAIQSKSAAEGTANARAGTDTIAPPNPITAGFYSTALTAGLGLPNGVTFDGMGRVLSTNIGVDILRVDIINATNASARRYVIAINTGGSVRMCDPALPLATNPQGCQ